MKYTIFYKLWNDMTEYSEHVDGEDTHELLRDCVDKHSGLREISIVPTERKHGQGRGIDPYANNSGGECEIVYKKHEKTD